VIRQRLLGEALVSRTATRSGPVFSYRKPQGPPPGADTIDRWLHKTIQTFDLTPLVSGDRLQTSMLADHLLDYLKSEATRAGVDWSAVAARLKQSSPHLRQGLLAFSSNYDARLRGQT
jgi:hypothetical protein